MLVSVGVTVALMNTTTKSILWRKGLISLTLSYHSSAWKKVEEGTQSRKKRAMEGLLLTDVCSGFAQSAFL